MSSEAVAPAPQETLLDQEFVQCVLQHGDVISSSNSGVASNSLQQETQAVSKRPLATKGASHGS